VTVSADGGYHVATRVLLVSASPQLSAEVERVVQHMGGELFVARDDVAAILSLGSTPYDVVLLEIEKGGADGFGFCRVIRQSSDAAVMLLLHPSVVGDSLLGYRMGADTYMVLPLDHAVLKAGLEALAYRVPLWRVEVPAEVRPMALRTPGVPIHAQ
jgi:two-component system, OmpR family, response regulator